jgi:hypothetical protein
VPEGSRNSRTLLCDAHCWALKRHMWLARAHLRVCGTSVYYRITGHSTSMCMLAHDTMDGAQVPLTACVRVHGTCLRARACKVR